MDLKAKIEAAHKRKASAESSITDADREEMKLREELAQAEAEAAAIERERRDLDLARRLDALREKLGADAALRAVTIKEYPDTFIVARNGRAHAQWTRRLSDASRQNGKIDTIVIAREYAVATIVDWNGEQDFSATTTNGSALIKFLTENPGVVTPITSAAAELNGAFAEERKS